MSDLRNGHASKPYSDTGMHLVRSYDLNNLLRCSPSNLTKYGIRGFKKDRFATLKEHLKVLELTMWIPRYLTLDLKLARVVMLVQHYMFPLH